MNGKSSEIAVKGAIGLLALLIVAIAAIIISGQIAPEIFVTMASMLVGFLIGTRVVTDAVKETVIRKEEKNDPGT